jgi:hypothetical protein
MLPRMSIQSQNRVTRISNAITSAYAANQAALCKLVKVKNPKTRAEHRAFTSEIGEWYEQSLESGKIKGKTSLEAKEFKSLYAERHFLDGMLNAHQKLADQYGF